MPLEKLWSAGKGQNICNGSGCSFTTLFYFGGSSPLVFCLIDTSCLCSSPSFFDYLDLVQLSPIKPSLPGLFTCLCIPLSLPVRCRTSCAFVQLVPSVFTSVHFCIFNLVNLASFFGFWNICLCHSLNLVWVTFLLNKYHWLLCLLYLHLGPDSSSWQDH